MSIDTGQIVTVGIFLGTQALSLVWTLSSMKGDNRVLRANMDTLQQQMSKMETVMATLADVRGDMRLIQQSNKDQALRIDEMQRRVNRRLEREEDARDRE